jgi:transcriptional regulator with XRE-family HTH domain
MDFKAIKAFRKQKGLNQEQLGKLCGVRKSTVSEWESGKARPSGSAALLLETYVSGDRCVVPLTDKEERLLDEGVQRGNFKNREEFLATCLVHLIREGDLPRVPTLTGKEG